MKELLKEINKFKKWKIKVFGLVLLNLSFILCYGQDQKQLVFGIDTSFQNEQEEEIVRYQIYIYKMAKKLIHWFKSIRLGMILPMLAVC